MFDGILGIVCGQWPTNYGGR